MKSRRIVSFVLVFPFLAGCLSLLGAAGQTAHAQDSSTEKVHLEPVAESEPKGPRTCPMVPIAVYGGDTLYEALYYETENCPPPTFTYAFGSFTYPQTCPACDAKKDKSPRPFYGLAMPVPADYKHKMPAGRPNEYTRPALTPNRIEYLYLKKQGVYVKVYAFDVNRKDMESGAPPNPNNVTETIYFAFECSDPATIGVNVAEIEVVSDNQQKPVPDPGGALTTVYDVTYAQEHILAFLCGNPEPPIDQQRRAANDQ